MAKGTGLKKYNQKLASLRRSHPNTSDAKLRKQASSWYKKNKGGAVGKPKRKKVNRHYPKKKVRTAGVSTNSKRHTDYNRNRVAIHNSKNITVGAVNAHKRAAKEKLVLLIGKEEAKKFKTPLKRAKKKIAKKIADYKRIYNKLC